MDIKRPGVTRQRRELDGVKLLGRKSRLAAGGRLSVTAAAAVIWLNTGNESRRGAKWESEAEQGSAEHRAEHQRNA